MVGKIPRPDRVGTRKNRSSRSDSGLARHGGLVVWDGRRDPSSRSDSGLARHRGLAAWDGRRDPSSLRSLPSAALRAGGMTMPRCIVRWPTEVVRYKGRTRECGSFGRTAWNDADGRRVRAGLIPIRLGTALRFVGPGWASAKPGSLPAGWESTTRGRCRASRQSTRDAKSAKARRYMDRQKTDRFGRDEGEGRACVRRAGLWYKEMRKAHRPSYGGQASLGCTRDERVPFDCAQDRPFDSAQGRQAGTGSRATHIDIRRISLVWDTLITSQGSFRPGRNVGPEEDAGLKPGAT